MNQLHDGCGAWFEIPRQDTGNTRVFARVMGRLACWEVQTRDHLMALDAVRGEIERGPVLALIERRAAQ